MNASNARSLRWKSACLKQPLLELLREELDEEKTEKLANHLDQCEECQQRLTTLAAGPSWWIDASQWLEHCSDGNDPCMDDLLSSEFDEVPSLSNEKYLLDSGLLKPSQQEGMIGVLGRYQVRRIIGAGGTGIVLQGQDDELNRVVAIKVLSPWLATHGPARRRFAREGQAVAAVVHENVVAIHHVEGNGPIPFLVMQYIDGDSLQDYVTRNGPLDVPTALRITAQVSAALSAAHEQGLVHRDVKPANILVASSGQRVWITDFGLARAVDDASLTRTGFIAGTPHYMSPEQARGETVQIGSDLFGLGSVLYFMLTGRPPFRAERTLAILHRICNESHRPIREVNPEVPSEVARLVDRLLEKEVAKRFPNGAEVRSECLRLLMKRESSFEKFSSPMKSPRFKHIKYLLLVPLLAVCVIGNLFVWKSRGEAAAMRDSGVRVVPAFPSTMRSRSNQSLIHENRSLDQQPNFGSMGGQAMAEPTQALSNPPQTPFVEETDSSRWLAEFSQLEYEIHQATFVPSLLDGRLGTYSESIHDRFLNDLYELDRALPTSEVPIRIADEDKTQL